MVRQTRPVLWHKSRLHKGTIAWENGTLGEKVDKFWTLFKQSGHETVPSIEKKKKKSKSSIHHMILGNMVKGLKLNIDAIQNTKK